MADRRLRVILNCKKAGLPAVREAIHSTREKGHTVDVRVTWEGGDAGRLAAEALRDESAMAVMPLGSANDFATGCGIMAGDPMSGPSLPAPR